MSRRRETMGCDCGCGQAIRVTTVDDEVVGAEIVHEHKPKGSADYPALGDYGDRGGSRRL